MSKYTSSNLPFLGKSHNIFRTDSYHGFSPRNFSGLKLWLQASYFNGLVTPDSAIGSEVWVDQSSQENNASQGGSGSPVYRQGGLGGGDALELTADFDERLDLTSNIALGSNLTILIVCSISFDSIIMGHSSTSGRARRDREGFNGIQLSDSSLSSSSESSSTSPIDNTDVHLTIFRINDSAGAFRANKTNFTGSGAWGGIALNRLFSGPSSFRNTLGKIGEIIVYDAYRTDAECDILYDNLALTYTFT